MVSKSRTTHNRRIVLAFKNHLLSVTGANGYAENPENGGGSIGYSSRQDSPDGSFVNATGKIDYPRFKYLILKVALSQKILKNFFVAKMNILNHYPEHCSVSRKFE